MGVAREFARRGGLDGEAVPALPEALDQLEKNAELVFLPVAPVSLRRQAPERLNRPQRLAQGSFDFARLRAALNGVQGRFLLSMNDVPATRELFAGFRLRTVRTAYSAANGRGAAGARLANRRELLVSNFPLKAAR